MSNENKIKKLTGKYIVTADIELVTGLHIGTSKEEVEVGGLDNPVVKDPFGNPYIPGSSLKGKCACSWSSTKDWSIIVAKFTVVRKKIARFVACLEEQLRKKRKTLRVLPSSTEPG